jgi:hypothetical protein
MAVLATHHTQEDIMDADVNLPADPAVNRSLGALQNFLSAQRETNARYRELQHANRQLDPAQMEVYAAEATKIAGRYRDGLPLDGQ